MTREQIAEAARLWRDGKNTNEIARELRVEHESIVANELAVIRGIEPRKTPNSVPVAAPPVNVPAWVAPQFRREYVRLTHAVGEDRAACAARMHLRRLQA